MTDTADSNSSQVQSVLEAAMFAAGKALTLGELAQLFDESNRPSTAELRRALAALQAFYADRAIELIETAAGYRMQVRVAYASEVAKLWPERPQRYSRALLETLALIAYRQPITRAEIEGVRGVAVNPNIIKTLIDRNWIRVVGHRDVPGQPELLGTTREFLDHFGLRSVDELPPLAEIRAMTDINPQLELPGTAEALAAEAGSIADDPVESADADELIGADESEQQADGEATPGLVARGPEDDR